MGSDKDIEVNVRVVAATNKDLKAEIEKGTFREDLYHRLSVILIRVPSLDERKDDIPLLVNYFVEQICAESGKSVRAFSPAGQHPRTAQRRRTAPHPRRQPRQRAGRPRLR